MALIRSAILLAAIIGMTLPPPPAAAMMPLLETSARSQAATCTDSVGPGIPAPASVRTGIAGFHAAWYGQSGCPTLCAGRTVAATVAFMNTGTLGWYAGTMASAAYLGTWGPEPGQDRPSALGGVETGWPSPNRVAVQSSAYIGPGQVSWFQFTLRAPATAGTYRLALRPLIEGAQWMEDEGVFWTIVVKTSDAASSPSTQPTTSPTAAVARTYYPAIGADGSRSFRVNALMYHYVSWLPPDPDRFRIDLTVSPTDFEEHLRYLKANGFNSISTVDLWWALDTGKPLPPKPVLLTFDDGYVDHHDVVLPLLRKYGMVGTFAVTANLVGRPGYMTRTMVRALADAGMDVVSHATDHYSVNRLPYPSQVYQLCTSRRILSEWTGKDIRHFVYPAGDHLPTPSAALTNCGYLSGYRKDGGSIQSSNEMYGLRRYRVRGQQGLAGLYTALQQ